jgi:predicted dehydrogenase
MHDNLINEDIWLIGAGYMAQEYAKVLKGQNRKFSVIGRSINSAEKFEEALQIPVFVGGLDEAISLALKPPSFAIIAASVDQLANACQSLIEFGVENILVEKPAGLNRSDVRMVCEKGRSKNAKVFVAYNRRFFSSTMKALEIIEEDGGVTSFNFEFTEWSHKINDVKRPKEVFESWFLTNSTHVIDLAFFLGGLPTKMSCYTHGTTEWYTKASIFAGAGITDRKSLFSYQANWKGPGRWVVEVITPKHRLIFKPIEKLQIQEIGSVAVEFVQVDDEIDTKYKPGLYLQTKAFLDGNHERLLGIEEHYNRTLIFEHIENGEDLQ